MNPFIGQIVNLFAAFLLLLSFAMLSQRRILSLINLFALQGLALVGSEGRSLQCVLPSGASPPERPPANRDLASTHGQHY